MSADRENAGHERNCAPVNMRLFAGMLVLFFCKAACVTCKNRAGRSLPMPRRAVLRQLTAQIQWAVNVVLWLSSPLCWLHSHGVMGHIVTHTDHLCHSHLRGCCLFQLVPSFISNSSLSLDFLFPFRSRLFRRTSRRIQTPSVCSLVTR